MAQTIAAQRGTTTNASDGVTLTTLFTQSTGTATRVILNGISMRTPSGGGSMARMALLINVNATGSYSLVALKQNCNAGRTTYGLAMSPDTRTGEPTVSTFSSSAGFQPSRWMVHPTNTGATYLGTDVNNNRWEQSGPQGSYVSSNDGVIDQVPSQFWMNSGDSLVVNTFNTNGYTANIVYNFTTITES